MVIVAFIIAALVAIIDQVIKIVVVNNLHETDSVTAIPYILDINYVENRGIAFGLFKDARLFFIIFTSIIIILLVFLLIRNKGKSKLFCIACGLIIGGGIGNLIDRIFRGYVIDYLSLSFFNPTCNFADYAITAGTILLVIYLLFFYKSTDDKVKTDGKNSN